MSSRRLLPLLLLSFLFTACSDDSQGDKADASVDASPPEPTLHETWDEQCDRLMACPEMRDAESCKSMFPCIETVFRPDALAASVECQVDRACGTSDDPCFSPALLGIQDSPSAAGFRDDCLARKAQCDTEPVTFGDDYCTVASMFRDSIITSLATCLARECGGVRDCFEGTVANADPTCTEL